MPQPLLHLRSLSAVYMTVFQPMSCSVSVMIRQHVRQTLNCSFHTPVNIRTIRTAVRSVTLFSTSRIWAVLLRHRQQADTESKIMSTHMSKGLQFPVVFVANCASSFNDDDYTGDVVISEEYAIASKSVDISTMSKIQSPAYHAAAQEVKKGFPKRGDASSLRCGDQSGEQADIHRQYFKGV